MSDELNTRQGRRKAQERVKKKNKDSGSGGGGKRGIFKKILVVLAILAGIGVVGGGITVAAIIAGAPDLDEEQLMLAQSVQIYDMNDERVSTLDSGETRINASIHDMPDHLKNAFIAVEDMRFYDHSGIDVRRLGGAIVANVTEGFGSEGASTITQQLVKNLFLSQEKQLTRKIQEQYLAIQLERQYSKDEILEMYLNQINLGSSAGYGVQIASERYFNKSLDELTIADAAVLAGIPRRPNFYDPHRNPENAESRRNLVIGLMEEQGHITAEEAEEARNTPIEEQMDYNREESYPHSTFYDEVIDELESMEELTVNDIHNSGLRVYTTLDVDAQNHVDDVLKSGDYDINFPDDEQFATGVTLLDTATGAVRAFGNGTEENDQRVTNYATERKQPGSTIKPLLDYAPLINEQQLSTGHIMVDEPFNYSEGEQGPVNNFDGGYQGAMSMRQALAQSRNVPAVKALQQVGKDNAYDFLEQMMPLDEGDDGRPEAGAIGGLSHGFSTEQLAGAFAALGNGGEFTEPHTIRKVVFPDNREINVEPESARVMEDYTAYMVTDMLKTAVDRSSGGTGGVAVEGLSNVPIAGKTGTTNFDNRDELGLPSDAVPSVSFSGYSTDYTASVWVGFDRGPNPENEETMDNFLTYSSGNTQLAQRVFNEVMKGVSTDDTPDFEQPDSVVERAVEASTGLLPSPATPSSQIRTELFVRGNETNQVSEEYGISDPSNVSWDYDEDSGSVTFTWSYPGDEIDDVSFNTNISSGSLSGETNSSATLQGAEPGETYTFTVQAVADADSSLTSDSISVEASIPEAVVEDEDENDEEVEEEESTEEEATEEEEPEVEEEPDQSEDTEEDPGDGADNGDADNDENGSDESEAPSDEGEGDAGEENGNDGGNGDSNGSNGDDSEDGSNESDSDSPSEEDGESGEADESESDNANSDSDEDAEGSEENEE
ncbi:PBP1A family penicillin-binding protein [Shouchella shacheensis]|uniref:PBP1A family penicillin-binding protein n=1 Tax=Shouchella shacheensis TaxID=1649580 RepID=UPI0007400F3E|nr:PBP1A family penicillin-binding protein [Shouchella shacheensis]